MVLLRLVGQSVLDAEARGWGGVERLPFASEVPNHHDHGSSYVAFNGDRQDPQNEMLRFYKYFYEPLAQDHEL